MNRWVIGIVVSAAVSAAAAPQGNCVRLGVPLSTTANTVSVAVDVDQPAAAMSSDTAVLDVSLPKLYYDAGEPVVLTTHLHTVGGADLDGGQMAVEDDVVSGPMDRGAARKPLLHGQGRGHGQHQVRLDNSAGEHHLIVHRDAVDASGNSVHRAAVATYIVATGEITFLDVGKVRVTPPLVVVELNVRSTGGRFNIAATLASGSTAVARVETQAVIDAGKATIELPFAQEDLVEPGPYRLVQVTAYGGQGLGLAAAPRDVGKAFQAPHVNQEPPGRYQKNDEGAYVGIGPTPYDPTAPDPTPPAPAPVVIPRWPEGEPANADGSPAPDAPVILDYGPQ